MADVDVIANVQRYEMKTFGESFARGTHDGTLFQNAISANSDVRQITPNDGVFADNGFAMKMNVLGAAQD